MKPLAERMRPQVLEDYIGQKQLIDHDKPLRKSIEAGHLPSCIFWGPPGVGKTTLANLIADRLKRTFYTLSAVQSGVKEVREVIESAKKNRMFSEHAPILFIDEIHRFSKSQQDSLLGAVEQGIITLIGATTENPSFEVISALLSRCQVYTLNTLSKEDLKEMLERVIEKDEICRLKDYDIQELDALIHFSGGDGRKFLNLFEILVNTEPGKKILINNEIVKEKLQKNLSQYDKDGENHYDIISAFIKSIRGSDANGAIYWLARMLAGGESLEFIGRRLIISASEDIGLANPNALLLAQSAFESIRVIGLPEARIILSQVTIYLANSPKSNESYKAINQAMKLVEETGDLPVPLHLRNAPTALMRDLNYGADYQYPHDFPNNWIEQTYLPEEIKNQLLYEFGKNAQEQKNKEFLEKIKGKKS